MNNIPTASQLAELKRIATGKNWKTTAVALMRKGWVAETKCPELRAQGQSKYVTFSGLKAIKQAEAK